MSAIASLSNIPSNQNELAMWSFAHAAHHLDINRKLYELFGVNLPTFVLDPFDIEDMGNWLYQHQNMHQAFDSILLIDGFDLSDVDWKDDNQRAGWIFLNFNEHYRAANILGIG